MRSSAIAIAVSAACLLFAGSAMAATASNITSGGEAGSSMTAPAMGAPATTGTAQGGATMMTNPAAAGDANSSDAMGARGTNKDSKMPMNTTQ